MGFAFYLTPTWARKEIERQFPRWSKLHSLNHYPHFVGTIQSFINGFLATNSVIALTGKRPTCLDDEQYAFELARRFTAHGKYKTAFAYVKNQLVSSPDPNPQNYLARKLRYTYTQGQLVLDSVSSNLGASTTSYKQLNALKEELTEVDPICWTEKRAFLDGVGGWKIRRANAQYQKESPAFVEGKSGRGGH